MMPLYRAMKEENKPRYLHSSRRFYLFDVFHRHQGTLDIENMVQTIMHRTQEGAQNDS